MIVSKNYDEQMSYCVFVHGYFLCNETGVPIVPDDIAKKCLNYKLNLVYLKKEV